MRKMQLKVTKRMFSAADVNCDLVTEVFGCSVSRYLSFYDKDLRMPSYGFLACDIPITQKNSAESMLAIAQQYANIVREQAQEAEDYEQCCDITDRADFVDRVCDAIQEAGVGDMHPPIGIALPDLLRGLRTLSLWPPRS